MTSVSWKQNISYLSLNHEFSFGKSDHWMGPAQGGSFAWSNNAENIYSFQIDRVEPLYVPLLSRLTGRSISVLRRESEGDPRDPWVHVEKISFNGVLGSGIPKPSLEAGTGSRSLFEVGNGSDRKQRTLDGCIFRVS
jgi:hypothetical protein